MFVFSIFRPVSCDLQTFRSTPGPQTATSFSTIQLPLQKLLFSATLTLSPEKLAPLQLFQPVLFTAAGTVTESKSNQATTAGLVCYYRYHHHHYLFPLPMHCIGWVSYILTTYNGITKIDYQPQGR